MKRSQLEELIIEELYKNLAERTVASRNPPRKMTGSQIARRDVIGKAMKKKPGVVSRFREKHGSDWEYYLWAAATNQAINTGE